MSARILVVDDIPHNVKILTAKLEKEYFHVIPAESGFDALEKITTEDPDIVLLDVMMPGMDGFEVCTRIKSDPATMHIPVIMITALSDTTDRVRGLESGADDFISKPIHDNTLISRVRSLVRLKMTIDEWRLREQTIGRFASDRRAESYMVHSPEDAKILIVEDDNYDNQKIQETMQRDNHTVVTVEHGERALQILANEEFELVIVSLRLKSEDGLRLCSAIRQVKRNKDIPILLLAEEEDDSLIATGLEFGGAYDYSYKPIDRNELLARVRTQIRRQRYQAKLRTNYEASLSMALTDPLTGLFNRRYLDAHLDRVVRNIDETNKVVCVILLDIDHFKLVNDTHGHNAGDAVLKKLADLVPQSLRSFDLFARYGGEEFALILPDIDMEAAQRVAERIRSTIEESHVRIMDGQPSINITVSMGGIILDQSVLSNEEIFGLADKNLYKAKDGGRNQVIITKHNPDPDTSEQTA